MSGERRFAGRAFVVGAGVYATLVLLVSGFAVWDAVDLYDGGGVFSYSTFDLAAALTWPASLLVPSTVVHPDEIAGIGVELALVGLAQAGVLALLGAVLLGGVHGRRWGAAGASAAVLVGLVVVIGLVAYEPRLRLPDRSDPAVRAQEAELATVVADSGVFLDGATTCKVRLLDQEAGVVFANAECRSGISAVQAPVRIDGREVRGPRDGWNEEDYDLFPRRVHLALATQDVRP